MESFFNRYPVMLPITFIAACVAVFALLGFVAYDVATHPSPRPEVSATGDSHHHTPRGPRSRSRSARVP